MGVVALIGLVLLGVNSVMKAKREQAALASTKELNDREQASIANLKQLGLGTLMYVQDYDERYPPMNDLSSVKSDLMPYLKNEQVFINPLSGASDYIPNSKLSYKKDSEINEPAFLPLFWEPAPSPGKTMLLRGVVFSDGHAKRIGEDVWPKYEAMDLGSTLAP